MANKRRFATPTALRKEIDRYFRSISRTAPVTELKPTGELDKYGHPVLEAVECRNDDGEPIRKQEFLVAPRMTALRLFLEVDAETWSRYASGEVGTTDRQREAYAAACAWAKAVCEDWLKGEKLTRIKGLAGVMHELEVNYGDGRENKLIVESRSPMTFDERAAILSRLGLVPEEGGPDETGDEGEA